MQEDSNVKKVTISEETRKKMSEASKGNKSTTGCHWRLVNGKREFYK